MHLHRFDKVLREEYKNVIRYFEIRKRSTPEPYLPNTNKLLSESKLLPHLKQEYDTRAISIYLHIPFCDRKCVFCDLYSFKVPYKNRIIIEEYCRILEHEIRFWGQLFEVFHRPVTTVHFGGGSPLIISTGQLKGLISTLKQYFTITTNTEIAVEITTSQITPENIQFLKENNFSRIHVGIQTYSDTIRNIIGRRESAKVVREKLKIILGEDFITSVDLLYGLPLQTVYSFRKDLELVVEQNVDGIALYELQTSRKLNNVIEQNPTYQTNKVTSYVMVLLGKKILNEAGYKNIFFNHYGNHRDKNLYFTYPQREEDCLSFGTIADGQAGNVFFRHKKYKDYMKDVTNGKAGIDYGYVEDDRRAEIRQFETHLMSTFIPAESITHLYDLFGYSFQGIFDLWRAAQLIRPVNQNGDFELTGSGCWFLSTMIKHIRRFI